MSKELKCQVFANEIQILKLEGVRVIVRAVNSDDMGASYSELFSEPLSDSDSIRHLAERLHVLRHALDEERPFRVEVLDGNASTEWAGQYRTVGELRNSYKAPGAKL